jgi:hypothetical protein
VFLSARAIGRKGRSQEPVEEGPGAPEQHVRRPFDRPAVPRRPSPHPGRIAHRQPVGGFDEYTSVVDRTVAQTRSHALQKTVRIRWLKFIAVTGHDDVTEWLQSDWTYEHAENRFTWSSL